VQAISFKNTALFKRGIWLSAAALVLFVAAPSALDDTYGELPSAIAVGIHRITILLRSASRLGRRIEFLPQASLWSNVGAIKQVALDLTHRATAPIPRVP
jgi:hypothetical protein